MSLDFGNVDAGLTLYIPFNTFDSNGASITITGLAITDIEIYKNGSTTQRSSDAGYVLLDTDGIDFDGITGIHGFSIDLADNTDADFYSAGAFYWVVISAITVDTRTVNFVAATFRIGPVAANATQILGTAISTPATAGILDVNVKNIDNDAASASGTVTFPNATLASTTNITAGVVTTATNVTTVNGLAANVITAAAIANGAIDAATFAAGAIDATAIADNAIDTATFAAGTTLPRVTLVDTVTTYTGNTPQTGDSFARLGAPAGASVSADIAAIEAQTDDIGVAGAGLTAITSKTDNLPSDPADQSLIIAATNAIVAILGTPAGASLAADIAVIESQTDDIGVAGAGLTALGDARLANLDATISSRLATAGYTVPPTTAENADKLLGRNLAGGSDGGRTVKDALRILRNKRSIAAGTLTVTAEDDTTPAWTATVATAVSNPVSAIDPA